MSKVLIIAGQVVAVLLVVLLASFGLDVFASEAPLWQNLVGFLIHSLPLIVLLAILVLSFRWPLAAGIVFLLAALAPFLFLSNALWVNALLAAPAALAGALLVIGSLTRRRA